MTPAIAQNLSLANTKKKKKNSQPIQNQKCEIRKAKYLARSYRAEDHHFGKNVRKNSLSLTPTPHRHRDRRAFHRSEQNLVLSLRTNLTEP